VHARCLGPAVSGGKEHGTKLSEWRNWVDIDHSPEASECPFSSGQQPDGFANVSTVDGHRRSCDSMLTPALRRLEGWSGPPRACLDPRQSNCVLSLTWMSRWMVDGRFTTGTKRTVLTCVGIEGGSAAALSEWHRNLTTNADEHVFCSRAAAIRWSLTLRLCAWTRCRACSGP
jgi:hypothetical protein